MKKERLIVIFIPIIFLIPMNNVHGFSYNNSVDSFSNYSSSIKPYEYDGNTFTISYIKDNSFIVLDVKTNTKLSTSISIPENNFYEVYSFKAVHLSGNDLLLAYAINNGTFYLKTFVYSNQQLQFSKDFTSEIYIESFDLFEFQNAFYLYFIHGPIFDLYNYNQSSNTWNLYYTHNYDSYYFSNFETTDLNFILSYQSNNENKFNVSIFNVFQENVTLVREFNFISSNIFIAPLSNSFLVQNDSSLIEVSLTNYSIKTLITNLYRHYPYRIDKISALSDQEIVIQGSERIAGFLLVNNVLAKAWEISLYDTNFYNIMVESNLQTKELVFFFIQQNQQNKENAQFIAYLLIVPGMEDPNESFTFSNFYTITDSYYEIPYNDMPIVVGLFLLGALSVIIAVLVIRYKEKIYSKSTSRSLTSKAKNMSLCVHCRNKLEEGSVYCSFCGKSQNEK